MRNYQEIEVEFAEVSVVSENKIIAQLKPLITKKKTIKGIRSGVEKHVQDFIAKATHQTRALLDYTLEVPLYDYRLPEVKVIASGEIVCHSHPYRIESKLVELSRWNIPRSAKSEIPGIVADACTKVIESQEVAITLKDDGVTLNCPLQQNYGNWSWKLLLTQTMLTYELGKNVNIKYGSFLHNALWRINLDPNDLLPFPEENIDPKTYATLKKLKLITVTGEVAPQGHHVLRELGEIDPSKEPGLVTLFTGTLFGAHKGDTPVFNFAKHGGFMLVDGNKTFTARPSMKGGEWLVDHAMQILHHSNITEARRLQLIPYMPLSHLPAFIASSEEKVRKAAKKRGDELKAMLKSGAITVEGV